MENPEEILHSLEEFSKTKPKDIPRELEEYLCFVAKTGDPVYQWPAIKSLFREKLLSVITEFYESCPSVDIPPCPNVDLFNYDVMKNFILEKLDTFAAAPFTLQRISELLTAPRKEYNRIDKYMRALEKNVLVVSTTEPGGRRSTENGDGIVNGLESEHLQETSNSNNEIKVDEIDNSIKWPDLETYNSNNETEENVEEKVVDSQTQWSDLEKCKDEPQEEVQETTVTDTDNSEAACSSTQDAVICQTTDDAAEEPYVSIEPVPSNTCTKEDAAEESDVSVTITAIPANVQTRRSSIEPVTTPESSDIVEKEEIVEENEVTEEETSSSTEETNTADSSSNSEEVPVEPDTELNLISTKDTAVEEVQVSSEVNEVTPEESPEEQVSTCTATEEATNIWYDANSGDQEITSSDNKIEKDEDIVESSGLDIADHEKQEDEKEEKITEEKEAIPDDSEPMEVGEIYTAPEEGVDEIVKAEATSDSNL